MSVIFKNNSKEYTIDNKNNETIMDLAEKVGLYIKKSCGGKNKCGNCIVYLIKGNFLVDNKEITIAKLDNYKALSCNTKILSSDATIEIPNSSIIEMSGKITDDFILKEFKHHSQVKKIILKIPKMTYEKQIPDCERIKHEIQKQTLIENIHIPLEVLRKIPYVLLTEDQIITVTLCQTCNHNIIINIESGDTSNTNFAVAIDIGTTTVVGILIDLNNAKIVSRASLYNQQIKIADDIVSRISYCSTQNEVDYLKKIIIQENINPIIEKLCAEINIKQDDINIITFSGNTVMIHLLLGLNPKNIGVVPFQPVIQAPDEFQAKEIEINILKNGIVDIIPAISGYIGGDITSDIYVSKIYEEKDLTIMIDIGTNGEIVLCENNKIIACSTAAGPAFEGYGLYSGSRASKGAIEKFFFKNNKINIEIIEADKASSICGTGYIDFIAEGIGIGLINYTGKFNVDVLNKLNLNYVIKEKDKIIKACIVSGQENSFNGKPILITELDISKIMLAKAAMFAGLQTLLTMKNKNFSDIKKFILSGSFAKHINVTNAIKIGLLPNIPLDRFEIIGNGSLAGAYLALVEQNALENMVEISYLPEVIQLNLFKDFQQYYIDAMFFNNYDAE